MQRVAPGASMVNKNLSDQVVAGRSYRETAESVLDRWIKGLDARTVLPNPHIPGVFKQPAYLVVPSLGKLIAIFVSWLPRRKRLWPSVLASLEDLFEVKISTGSNTVVGLVILGDPHTSRPLTEDMETLLKHAFDFCLLDPPGIREGGDEFLEKLSAALYHSTAKEEHLKLWERERLLAAENLRRYDKRVVRSLLRDGPYTDWPLRRARAMVAARLQDELGPHIHMRRDVPVWNIKHWFLDSQIPYYFTFDLEIPLERPLLVQITKGRASRTYRQDLRSLAVRARLIRYKLGPDRQLQPRIPRHTPWLGVTGHLRGPAHDETRYVRAMIAAGWHLSRADLLTAEKITRGS